MEQMCGPIVGAFTNPIVQYLIAPIVKHSGFLVCPKKYVKDMNSKMKKLKETAKEVEDKCNKAAGNTEAVPERAYTWLKAFNNLEEKIKKENTIGCFNVVERYKLGKQPYRHIKEIKDLDNQSSEIIFTNEKQSLAEIGSTSTAWPSTFTPKTDSTFEIGSTSTGPSTYAPVHIGTKNMFESTDLIFNEALQSIQSNEYQKMIALCGMSGVGKTTMMERLKKAVEDSKMFVLVVKVVVGENTDTIVLQQAIAEYINIKDFETTKDARADRLRMTFEGKSQKGKKKILVIMDDLRKEFNLKDVGLSPLQDGIKLLFTSQFENVCTRMGVKTCSIYKVPFLDDVEAGNLFFKTVGECDDHELQKIGKDIVKKCGGLPQAVVVNAERLSGCIKEEWEEVLANLQHDLGDIMDANFKRSYNDLEKEDDKAIFLLSGLFPNDFNISIEDLMKYGWGLKLFTKVGTLEEARRRAKICVNNLIRANLLTESDHMGCVKMHCLLRSFVLSNFSKVKQASIVKHDNKLVQQGANESYERILIKCTSMSEFPTYFNYPNLLLLILLDADMLVEFPKDFYRKMKKIQVVSCEKSRIPLLPETFQHSTKLRTLCLHACPLMDDISVLESLYNLEMLSVAHCNIRRLPSTIGKLEKLKLLDLTGCVDLCIDDKVFENLYNLEELYMRAQSVPIKFTDANLFELENLSKRLLALELEFFENKAQPKYVSFGNLKRFRISIGCELEYNENYAFRNTLKIVTHYDELHSCNISVLFEKVEELRLQVDGMKCFKDVSMNHSFSNLRDLHVSECADLTQLFTFDVASGLSKLERLIVSECRNLKTLVDNNNNREAGVIRFKKLNSMSLKGLPEMVSLSENVMQLPELVELKLDGLPNLTSIYCDNNNTSFLKEEVETPKLEKLEISNMKNLRQIWSCNKNNISMLREITVKKCDSFINLSPSNPLPLLNNLEKLEVCECGSVKVLFNINFKIDCGIGGYSSRLKSIRVVALRKLEELWRIIGAKDNNMISGYEALEIIEIIDCYSFKHIFTPVTTNFNMKALTTYKNKNTLQEINDTVNEERIEVDECKSDVTYPSYLLRNFNHLQHLKLYNDKRVKEVVFEMNSQLPPLLPYLKVLKLKGLKEMSHVWKCCNWNKFLNKHSQFPFQNLTRVSLHSCHKIKYLFSPHMDLSNLKEVHIENCDDIEEVISNMDDENEENIASTSTHKNTTVFSSLDTLKLKSLRRINGSHSIHDQFQSAQVNGEPINNGGNIVDEGCANGGVGTRLKNPILKNNFTIVLQLSNLKFVHIYKCDVLTYIFTFSTLESLKQLKELKVISCKQVELIVKKENGTSSKAVVLPVLENLKLDNLPKLKSFFFGMNDFKLPLLVDVMINDCPQLTIFTSCRYITPKLKYIQTSLGKHSHNFHLTNNKNTLPSSSDPTILKATSCSFHNLQEINIEAKDVEKVIPHDALPQLQMLEQVHLTKCHKVKEIFEVALTETNKNCFNESVEIPKLTQIHLKRLDGLEYLWKSNQWMVLKFPCLTSVSIQCCQSLQHVFTCSMVDSLLQLQNLHISECKNIEVIVKDEEVNAEVNCTVRLPFLKSIKLEHLPGLKGFCLGNKSFEWPSLDTLHINECCAITDFTMGYLSTPKLKVIHASFEMCYVPEDLNSFMKSKQEEGYKF